MTQLNPDSVTTNKSASTCAFGTQKEKPTKAVIGLVLLLAIGIVLYGLNGKPADTANGLTDVAHNSAMAH